MYLCCIGFRQTSRQDVTYSWWGFTEHSWQTHEWLPGTVIPWHPLCHFPKRSVMLCHYGNKWPLVLKCIDNYGKNLVINYTDKLLCFFCLFSFPLLSWRKERPRISWGLWRKVDATSSKPTTKETLQRASRLGNTLGYRKDRGWGQGEDANGRVDGNREQSNTNHRSSVCSGTILLTLQSNMKHIFLWDRFQFS